MLEKIREIVAEFAYGDLPDDNEFDLLENGVIDSLGIFSILSGLENEFGIEIDGEDISKQNFCSIAAMARMVTKYSA